MSTHFENKPRCTLTECTPEPFTARDGREFNKCTKCNNLVFPEQPKKMEISPSVQKKCLAAGHGELEVKMCREGTPNAGREYETCKKCNAFVRFTDGKPSNKRGTKRGAEEISNNGGISADQVLAAILCVESEVKKARTEILAALDELKKNQQ